MILSDISENLGLTDIGNNGDSVPATVPGSVLIRLMRQRLNLGTYPDPETHG